MFRASAEVLQGDAAAEASWPPSRTRQRPERQCSSDAGAAYYQVACVPADTAPARGAIDDREEILGRGRTESLEVHVYGGQLRLGLEGKDTPVVVAGDGNVVWHSPAHLVQGHQDPRGDLVGSAQHGVDIRHLLQQSGDRSAGPPLGP